MYVMLRGPIRVAALAVAALGLLALGGCLMSNNGNGNQPAPSSAAAAKNFIGLHVHDPIHHWPSMSFSTWRMWDSGVDWARVEPARGQFDFTLLDQFVSIAESHNVKIIYVLGNTPAWAAQDPTAQSNEGIPGASSPPTDIQDWQNFVQTVATRYKGRIQAYEVWNEADLAGYWTGTVNDMLQMVQIAFTTIKNADSSALVLAPSLVGGLGPQWLQQFFDAGGNKFTDAIPFHLYFSTSPAPEDELNFNERVIALAKQHGKQIWDTEVGWGPWGTFDDATSAAYVARVFLLQTGEGLSHIVWYAWDDRGPWVHLFLVQQDMQTPTQAGIAFREVQSWVQNSDVSCAQDPSDLSWRCQLTASDGTVTHAVWNPIAAETFAIPSSWNVGHVRDLQGNVQAVTNGQVNIGAAPVLLEP